MAAPSQRHKDHSACTWLVEVPAAETSTHLASAVAQAWWSSHKLARSGGAFDGSSVAKAQSKTICLHLVPNSSFANSGGAFNGGGYVTKAIRPSCRCVVGEPWSTAVRTSTHLASTSASHRGAAHACLIRWSMPWRLRRKAIRSSFRWFVGVPAVETSTHLVSASAIRLAPRSSRTCLLRQMEERSMAAPSQRQSHTILQLVGWSAGDRDEHAP